MSDPINLNMILGQSNTIKEVHNVRKQSLEMSQQFIARNADAQQRAYKAKIQDTEKNSSIEDKTDEDRNKQKDGSNQDEKRENDFCKDEECQKGGSLIDITV